LRYAVSDFVREVLCWNTYAETSRLDMDVEGYMDDRKGFRSGTDVARETMRFGQLVQMVL